MDGAGRRADGGAGRHPGGGHALRPHLRGGRVRGAGDGGHSRVQRGHGHVGHV